jgi:hypothetical protein
MSLNFPSSPVVGEVFTAEGVSFVWSGLVWYVLDAFPWATTAEGLEGLATNKISTPASTAALLDTVPSGRAFNQGVPQDFIASRSQDVNYQWTGARPMMISVAFSDRDDTSVAELRVGPTNVNPPAIILGRTFALRGTGVSSEAGLIGVVPAGWWYRVHTVARRPSTSQWWEWRNAPAS